MAAPAQPLAGMEILVLEDDALLRRQTQAALEELGASVVTTSTLAAARKRLADSSPDFALLDVNLPDGQGTDLLRDRVIPQGTGVIVVTAEAHVRGATEAMRLGALDYLVKPFDPAELPLVLERAKKTRQTARLDEHRRSSEQGSRPDFFFGEALKPLEAQIEKVLAADRRLEINLPPVLIQGETGTGKSTIARWLHSQGPRSAAALVEVNCSTLPETLAESELFGHERGAFTDARSARIGLFEAAHGGTLFLDELPSLSLPLQAKVLTAIEDRVIRRLGGNRVIPVDVRLVTATNRDLRIAVADGVFREDLYHRLDLFRLVIPPVRERGRDVVRLAELYLAHLSRRHRLTDRTLGPEALARLRAHRWPGNVRELAHEIERALVFEDGPVIRLDSLPMPGPGAATGAASGPVAASPQAADPQDWFNPAFRFPESGFSLEAATDRLVEHALSQTDGNVSAAARLLGVSRDVVRYRMAQRKPGAPDPATA